MDTPFKLGAFPSKPDARDFVAQVVHPEAALQFPPVYAVQNLPPVRNQQNEGTCVGHALVGILDYYEIKGKYDRQLSVRDAYAGARVIEPVDGEGSTPRSALKNAQQAGVCHEKDWPYVPQQPGSPGLFAAKHRPPNKVGAYAQVPLNALDIKANIFQRGPLLIVIPVTDGFWEPNKEGMVSLENIIRGYHAVVLVGYDDSKNAYLLRNSWGTEWGQQGYCWLPYSHPIVECWTVTANITQSPKPLPTQIDFWAWLKSVFRF